MTDFDEIFALDFAYLYELSDTELFEEMNKESSWPELIQEALSLLYDKNQKLANKQSVKIISESLGDVYLQGYALFLLFSSELGLAIEIVKEKSHDFDLDVFKTALDEIYWHRLYTEEFPELLSAIDKIKERLSVLNEEEKDALGDELVMFETAFMS